uniref:Uncharacterized protein n=1 Tax=Arundo donax TaxID=35708 RepID=A0A0A9CYK7_ARUDO
MYALGQLIGPLRSIAGFLIQHLGQACVPSQVFFTVYLCSCCGSSLSVQAIMPLWNTIRTLLVFLENIPAVEKPSSNQSSMDPLAPILYPNGRMNICCKL